jgi:hypothetical protein
MTMDIQLFDELFNPRGFNSGESVPPYMREYRDVFMFLFNALMLQEKEEDQWFMVPAWSRNNSLHVTFVRPALLPETFSLSHRQVYIVSYADKLKRHTPLREAIKQAWKPDTSHPDVRIDNSFTDVMGGIFSELLTGGELDVHEFLRPTVQILTADLWVAYKKISKRQPISVIQ